MMEVIVIMMTIMIDGEYNVDHGYTSKQKYTCILHIHIHDHTEQTNGLLKMV